MGVPCRQRQLLIPRSDQSIGALLVAIDVDPQLGWRTLRPVDDARVGGEPAPIGRLAALGCTLEGAALASLRPRAKRGVDSRQRQHLVLRQPALELPAKLRPQRGSLVTEEASIAERQHGQFVAWRSGCLAGGERRCGRWHGMSGYGQWVSSGRTGRWARAAERRDHHRRNDDVLHRAEPTSSARPGHAQPETRGDGGDLRCDAHHQRATSRHQN